MAITINTSGLKGLSPKTGNLHATPDQQPLKPKIVKGSKASQQIQNTFRSVMKRRLIEFSSHQRN